MNIAPLDNLYTRHRFPAEIISHGVWLYGRFCLSYRDVAALMAERGVLLTDEAVRYWCRKCGQASATRLRRRHPRPGDTWHLDDVLLTIQGARPYVWRVVDQDGHVLAILVQRRRDKAAAKTCFRRLLKGLTDVLRVIVSDQLGSYRAAEREILPSVVHRQQRYLHDRAAPPVDPPTGTADAAVSIPRTRPTLPRRIRADCFARPAAASSLRGPCIPSRGGAPMPNLAGDCGLDRGCIRAKCRIPLLRFRLVLTSQSINLTMPPGCPCSPRACPQTRAGGGLRDTERPPTSAA